MRKILLFMIGLLCTLNVLAKPKETNLNDGWFKFKNQTEVGLQVGWGPSFDCEGGATDYTLEVWNGTVSVNYSENGRYVVKGPMYGLNPSVFTWSFGYDMPVFTKERFQWSLNPMVGWEVKCYHDNAHYTKMGPVLKERSGPRFGIGSNFDVTIFDKMGVRASAKWINKTLDFGVGVYVRR